MEMFFIWVKLQLFEGLFWLKSSYGIVSLGILW